MALALQVCSYLFWFPLKILVISAILRSGVRRYPLIFTYTVATFLIVVAQMPAAFVYHGVHSSNQQSEWFQLLHAIGQGITYTLILAVVISFIYRATSGLGIARLVRLVSTGGALLFTAVSFAVHYDQHLQIGRWMTPWTRDLNFFAAILDLVLWGLLLVSRERDQRLLMLTGGMGIMFAGEALADAIRSIAIRYRNLSVFNSAVIVMMAADLAFLYVWWQAFRKEPAKVGVAVPRTAAGERIR